MVRMSRDEEIRRALRDFLIPELRAVGKHIERVGQYVGTRLLSPEAHSLRTEIIAHIRRLDLRIDDVERDLRIAIREGARSRKPRRSD